MTTKVFPQLFIEKVNALHGGGKIALLVDVTLDPDTPVIKYYTGNEDAVTFDGKTYDPLPMLIEEFSSNTKGELPAIKVSLSNIGNEALDIFENYNVLENMITARVVSLDVLDDNAAQDSAELMIIAVAAKDRSVGSLILGLPIGTDEEVPREVYTTEKYPGIPSETNAYGI